MREAGFFTCFHNIEGVTEEADNIAYAQLANSAKQQLKYNEEEKYLLKLTTMNITLKEKEKYYSELGIAYFNQFKFIDGKQSMLKSIKIGTDKSNQANSYYNIGIASLQQQEFDTAVYYLNESLKLNPNFVQAKQILSELNNRNIQK